MPCREWFEAQEASYRQQVLPPEVRARVSVEAAVAMGWRDFVGDDGESHVARALRRQRAVHRSCTSSSASRPDRVVAAAHASLSKVGATSGSTTGN